MAGRAAAAAARSSKSQGGTVLGVPTNVLVIVGVVALGYFALNYKPAASGAAIDSRIDASGDGTIDAHELLVAAADTTGDGKVDHDELQALADKAASGVAIPQPGVSVDPSMDLNNDGKVDVEDFDFHIKRWLIVGGGVILVIVYVFFHKNEDPIALPPNTSGGYLERFAKAGMIFDAADTNKNGELTLEELTAYLKSEAGKDAKAVLGEDLSVQDFKTDTRPAMTKAQFQDWYIAKAQAVAEKNAGGYFTYSTEEQNEDW